MAEGDGYIYNNFKEQVLNGEFNLGSSGDTINVILVSGHSPDIDADAGYADVSGDEYGTGSGYTVAAEPLTSQPHWELCRRLQHRMLLCMILHMRLTC